MTPESEDGTTIVEDADPVARMVAELDAEATGVAVFDEAGRLVHANSSLKRFLAGRDPEVAAQPDAEGRVHLPDGRSVLARRLDLDDGAWAVLVPSPQDDAEFMREVLDSLDTTIVAYDRDDRYLFGNVAYHRRYPHLASEDELVGRTFEQMLRATLAARSYADAQAERDPEAFVARRIAEFRENQPSMAERMMPSGHWEKVRVIDTPQGLRLSLRTRITEVKRVQDELRRAKERLEAEIGVRASFIKRLSHEFRTPLSAVLGYSEMIEQEVLGPLAIAKYRDYAALIRHSGQHLLELVGGLADEIGQSAPAPRDEPIEIARFLAREMTVVAPMAQGSGVQLVVSVPDSLPDLAADARMLRQMLLNLLSNAVRYSPGGIVGTSASLREDGGLSISVADNGAGITAEVLARLGEPYYRGTGDGPDRPAGTGLGLAVVKELMALHQGWLTLESEPGVGTTATLEFPPARSVPGAAAAEG